MLGLAPIKPEGAVIYYDDWLDAERHSLFRLKYRKVSHKDTFQLSGAENHGFITKQSR